MYTLKLSIDINLNAFRILKKYLTQIIVYYKDKMS